MIIYDDHDESVEYQYQTGAPTWLKLEAAKNYKWVAYHSPIILNSCIDMQWVTITIQSFVCIFAGYLFNSFRSHLFIIFPQQWRITSIACFLPPPPPLGWKMLLGWDGVSWHQGFVTIIGVVFSRNNLEFVFLVPHCFDFKGGQSL